MGLVQGNITTLDTAPAAGFIPEVNSEGVFSLFLVLCSSTSTEKILVHQETLNIPAEHCPLVEGHAREMMLVFMREEKDIHASDLAKKLQKLTDTLTSDDTSELERTCLTYPEGSGFMIRCGLYGNAVTLIPLIYRFEVYDRWAYVIADESIDSASLNDESGMPFVLYNNQPVPAGSLPNEAITISPF